MLIANAMNSMKSLIKPDARSSCTNSTSLNGKICLFGKWEFVRKYGFFARFSPESVRTRSDMFYLQPERSCVPDSPVWFSAHMELPEIQIDKMLQRILMVREVQEHMLADGLQNQ